MSMLSDRGGRCLEGIRVVLRVVFVLVVVGLLFWLVMLIFDMRRMNMTRRALLWRWNLSC